MQSELALKPCPFCGEAPRRVEHPHFKILTCSKVFCVGNGLYFSPELWNIRPIEDALRAENETLRAKCEAYEELVGVLEEYESLHDLAGDLLTVTNNFGLPENFHEYVGTYMKRRLQIFSDAQAARRALEDVCGK